MQMPSFDSCVTNRVVLGQRKEILKCVNTKDRPENGDLVSQEKLIDVFYFAGKSPSNRRAAIAWAIKAAKGGSAQGEAFLGHAHYMGLGGSKRSAKGTLLV